MAADVQPVAGEGVVINRLAVLKEQFHQVGEVQVALAPDVVKNPGLKR